jgi:methyl-accepting chemotaxis protein PixJ
MAKPSLPQLQFRQLRALSMHQIPSPPNSPSTTPKALVPLETEQPQQSPKDNSVTSPRASIRTKVTLWALGVSVVPTLLVGLGAYGTYQSLQQQLEAAQLEEMQGQLKATLPPLAIGTGLTAVVAGAIATLLTRRTLRPALQASFSSSKLVNRLQRDEEPITTPQDELQALNDNLRLIHQQLPGLLATHQEEAQKQQLFREITQRFQNCRTEEDLLNTTVTETRQILNTDRVSLFRFNADGNGTFVAEDVVSGWAKLLWSTVEDPCFNSGYSALYQEGRVRAIDNIYTANLSDCHIGLLEQFGVKANLIAPVLKDGELFGLLIAHQCSNPRVWLPTEVNLMAQIASQISGALDSVRRMQQINDQAEHTHQILTVSRSIRASLEAEDVLSTAVTEVRKTLKADRVVVYTFDHNWYGTVVAESVLPGFPKALWAEIHDPCFAEGFIEQYQAGRVHAIDNVQAAGLGDCYLQQLEAFDVKANLVAPILKDHQLSGLLIAHQCSGPRQWRQSDLDFMGQIALQVGFALDHARLTARLSAEDQTMHLIKSLTQSIRSSLIEDDIISTTVTEMRKALKADRVIIYGFDANWYGTVVAEAVLPGFPKALWANIKDPCFAEGFVSQYQAGRVHSIADVQSATMGNCYRQQLEQFEIRANLVTPILKDQKLFALLIAHQCSGPRQWQPTEINLMTQIAQQVGYALDHARLLAQVEQAYAIAQGSSTKNQHQKEALQEQVTTFLAQSSIQDLADQARQQMTSVSTLYNQVKALADSTTGMVQALEQGEQYSQQVSQMMQANQEAAEQVRGSITGLQEAFTHAATQVASIEQPTGQLSVLFEQVSALAAQVKLQAMNVTLESARMGNAGQGFADIGEAIHTLTRQLDSSITDIKPLVASISTNAHQAAAVFTQGERHVRTSQQSVADMQQQLGQIAASSYQLLTLVEQMTQTTANQAQQSTAASQSVVEVANLTHQTAETSAAVVESFNHLVAAVHGLD